MYGPVAGTSLLTGGEGPECSEVTCRWRGTECTQGTRIGLSGRRGRVGGQEVFTEPRWRQKEQGAELQ